MSIKPALIFPCLFFINSIFSQTGTDFGVVNVAKINVLSPGVSYEQKIGRFQTVYGSAFLSPSGYWGYSDALGTSSRLYLDPAITVQYRYYYNALRRGAKGKNTELNSLNYVAPVFKTTFHAEDSKRSLHRTGIVWGLQRNYRGRFSLDLNVGLGYAFAKESRAQGGEISFDKISEFTTIGQLNLGFWLNRRKS